jgi:hypothetical protein
MSLTEGAHEESNLYPRRNNGQRRPPSQGTPSDSTKCFQVTAISPA